MREHLSELAAQLCLAANRFSTYALFNLVDDPAILAMAFC